MLVEVTTPFHISVDGETVKFDAGVHDIHEKLAAHWFVKAMTRQLVPADAGRQAQKKAD